MIDIDFYKLKCNECRSLLNQNMWGNYYCECAESYCNSKKIELNINSNCQLMYIYLSNKIRFYNIIEANLILEIDLKDKNFKSLEEYIDYFNKLQNIL